MEMKIRVQTTEASCYLTVAVSSSGLTRNHIQNLPSSCYCISTEYGITALVMENGTYISVYSKYFSVISCIPSRNIVWIHLVVDICTYELIDLFELVTERVQCKID